MLGIIDGRDEGVANGSNDGNAVRLAEGKDVGDKNGSLDIDGLSDEASEGWVAQRQYVFV